MPGVIEEDEDNNPMDFSRGTIGNNPTSKSPTLPGSNLHSKKNSDKVNPSNVNPYLKQGTSQYSAANYNSNTPLKRADSPTPSNKFKKQV